jgi:AraC-like DNA-binding protein
MDDAKTFWLGAAETYIADCRVRATSVRASEFAVRMERTPVQLAREFHASVGSCVKDYFSARQLERARDLLLRTTRDTADIAIDAGFGTARTFYRAFRKSMGMSPTEYRKGMSLAAHSYQP